MTEYISVNHLGFLCAARKFAIVRDLQSSKFEIQNMALNREVPMGSKENYRSIYEGSIEHIQSDLGDYGICDFTAIQMPGVYRVVLPETETFSFQFVIADGAFARMPYMLLDFVHELRSGYHATDLHSVTNTDDGVRSDTGEQMDASGGWYDAGDTRKWLAHSTLPVLGFMDVEKRLNFNRRMFTTPVQCDTDWLTEAAWGLPFIRKMQDPETGMIYEDVGGGGGSRRVGDMPWWYSNHAGCYADNSDNHFTDNTRDSGDERTVRIQYNPIVQYTNITLSTRAYMMYAPIQPELTELSYHISQDAWQFCQTRLDEEEHTWTSVRAWRAIAALERYQAGLADLVTVELAINNLLENFNPALGWWHQATKDDDPYRGILHSAQPLIALAKYLDTVPDGALINRIKLLVDSCKSQYIQPMSQSNPYGFMPFGLYRQPASQDDTYRTWRDGLLYRFFMPANHHQRINHGLAGHWMSWAHGLAYLGRMLNDDDLIHLAWAQIYWLLGNNDYDISFISGLGYNNPMPHSRFLGTIPGGFMNGFRGTVDDNPYFDQNREAEWSSTEYWNVPLSNCLMALSWLLPANISAHNKLGIQSSR